jgi:acetyl esterase/lipase
MVAVTADYRVASRHKVPAIECVRDAVAAMRYVRANAERLGVDPDKIVSAGGSAGGHLAACVGTIEGLTDGVGKNGAVSYKPNAMVLFNPALYFGDPPGLKLDASRVGANPQDVSPFHHVKAGAPPTLLLFGTADGMVAAARAFTDTMKAAGNRCELDLYEDQPHGFFNVGRNNDHYRQTLESVDKFLESLGYLQGPPTVATYYE